MFILLDFSYYSLLYSHQDIDLGLSKEDIIKRYGEEYWIERYGKKKKKRKRKKKN